MTTYIELRQEISRIEAIKVDGFDSDYVLRAAAREIALINIEKLKPFTHKYNLIVRYLVTGDESIREEVRVAAVFADAVAVAVAVAAAESTINASTVRAAISGLCSYEDAIQILRRLSNDYLGKLDVIPPRVEQP